VGVGGRISRYFYAGLVHSFTFSSKRRLFLVIVLTEIVLKNFVKAHGVSKQVRSAERILGAEHYIKIIYFSPNRILLLKELGNLFSFRSTWTTSVV
jgi:hypothetical protein